MRKVIIIIALLCITSACFYNNNEDRIPPEISDFSAYPDTIISGQSVTLSWQINNASSARIEPIMINVDAAGEMLLKPSSACFYTLVAENEYGTDNKTIEIEVLPAPMPGNNDIPFPPVIYSFKAEPDEIWAGAPIQITWEVSDATEVLLKAGNDEINLKPDNGSIVFHPVISTSYLLIAGNPGGSAFATTRVEIFSSIGSPGDSRGGGGG